VPPTSPLGSNDNPARDLIPGAYERNTLTRRQPGAMGGAPHGADYVPGDATSLAAATITEREKEGGGGASQRPSK